MRFARDCGDLSLLLPDDITTIHELPYNIFDAIKLALVWLSYEELESQDRPPKSIWLDGKQLAKHFKAVRRRQKQRWGIKDDDIDTEIDGPTERNALVDDLLR